MIRYLRPSLLGLLAAMTISAVFAQTDKPGSKDYPGISRMPNFYINNYKYAQFDSFSFTVSENGKDRKQPVEGQLYAFRYVTKQGATPVSALQIVRNFQNAVRAAGGQVMRDTGGGDSRQTTLRLTRGSSEIWVDINAYTVDYDMTIVEKQAMQQDVTVDAKAMADGLTATGHVEVPGIFFDTGKSVVKPESDVALKEIAKLLQANLAMKVWVVGHTDAVGSPESNLTLSNARATAVIQALTQKNGVDAKRLAPFGAGPYAPVASNKSEEGRAKNRRVELVEHL